MDWTYHYQRWMHFPALDEKLRRQLCQYENDPQTLADCFSQPIDFGTGGMRGELGPGINRINVYTIRKAAEGLSRFLLAQGERAKRDGVVIAYDNRHLSREFALESAKVIGKHGIHVYLFDRLCPTPLLSYAVRQLGASAGIVITASHNPPEYNGFKVYGPDGGQITPDIAERLMAKINAVENELMISTASENELLAAGLLTLIGDELLDGYLARLKSLRETVTSPPMQKDALSIVFTPLHGTTLESITRGLKLFGYSRVSVVREQAAPDPNFTHAHSPNPEDPQAFQLAIAYGKETGADVLLATDPDGDRLGVAVKDEQGEYIALSGNQVGALLLHYLLSMRQQNDCLPERGVVVKTVVTSDMGRSIASRFGVSVMETLTGFKYIGEKMRQFAETMSHDFLFGYEESCGYVLFDLVRDKDAIQAALMMADFCAWCKTNGSSPYRMLMALYEQVGYYQEELVSLTLKGAAGQRQIAAILNGLRAAEWKAVNGLPIIMCEDYLSLRRRNLLTGKSSDIALPRANMHKYVRTDGAWFCIRPSGTESKIKLYFGVKGASMQHSRQQLSQLKEAVMARIKMLAD